jgi:hypothetical protein
MTRRSFAIVAALGLVPLLAPAPRAQQTEVGGRVAYVAVTGRNDVPVTDLTAANFRVREDNQNREVLNVAPAPPPSHLTILLDDGQAVTALSMVQDFRKVFPTVFREALKLMPQAQISYWTLGEPPTQRVPFTTSITSFDAALTVDAGRPGPGASLLEAVYLSAGEMRAQNAPRPVIVAFLMEDNPEIAERRGEVVETMVRESRVSFWTIALQPQMRSQTAGFGGGGGGGDIGAGGRGGTDMSLGDLTAIMDDTANRENVTRLRDRGYVMGDVSRRSGGVERRVGSKQDVGPMFSRVLNMIASRYAVTYARPAGAPIPRRLEIRLQGKSGSVAAPQWTAQ